MYQDFFSDVPDFTAPDGTVFPIPAFSLDRMYICDPAQYGTSDLDYYTYFLNQGLHERADNPNFQPDPALEFFDPVPFICEWNLDAANVDPAVIPCTADNAPPGSLQQRWPMTLIDCTLGLDNVIEAENDPLDPMDAGMALTMTEMGDGTINVEEALLCAFRMLGGRGHEFDEGGFCVNSNNVDKCKANTVYQFGGFFGKGAVDYGEASP
jgi:hypothetical protein